MPRHVYLWSLANPVIIVPAPTGIVYCNQVDGVACQHRQLEGYLLPLPATDATIFRPDWWYRHHNHRYAGTPADARAWADIAEQIERACAGLVGCGELPRDLRVIEDLDNVEAWVRVAFRWCDMGSDASGEQWVPVEGVLTWDNCD
jgi:hypothetical protein